MSNALQIRDLDLHLVTTSKNELPALATPPERGEVGVTGPLVSTGIFAVGFTAMVIALSANAAILIPSLFVSFFLTACWFFISLAGALAIRELRYSHQLRKWEEGVSQEIGMPYDRWRVYTQELEHTVELQLIKYTPQHKIGQTPSYISERVERIEFSPDDEIAALEKLEELNVLASERETEAKSDFERLAELKQSTSSLHERLQQQLPKTTP